MDSKVWQKTAILAKLSVSKKGSSQLWSIEVLIIFPKGKSDISYNQIK